MFDRFFKSHPRFQSIMRIEQDQSIDMAPNAPKELNFFWKKYGFGTYMNGYLKIVPPKTYLYHLQRTYDVFKEPTIIFAATAMADLLVWEGDCVKQFNYRTGTTKIFGESIKDFFNFRLTDWKLVEEAMNGESYRPCVQRFGVPAIEECFGYAYPAWHKGQEDPDVLQVMELHGYLKALSQNCSVII